MEILESYSAKEKNEPMTYIVENLEHFSENDGEHRECAAICHGSGHCQQDQGQIQRPEVMV